MAVVQNKAQSQTCAESKELSGFVTNYLQGPNNYPFCTEEFGYSRIPQRS